MLTCTQYLSPFSNTYASDADLLGNILHNGGWKSLPLHEQSWAQSHQQKSPSLKLIIHHVNVNVFKGIIPKLISKSPHQLVSMTAEDMQHELATATKPITVYYKNTTIKAPGHPISTIICPYVRPLSHRTTDSTFTLYHSSNPSVAFLFTGSHYFIYSA